MIEIRKYSNRRLYDTSTSQYVTLSDVAQMIRDGVEIRVVGAKTGEDLTRSVMLQIICESKFEQEALPINFLRQVIQASSKTVRTSIKDFLSAGVSAQKEMAHWVRLGAMANPLVAPFVAAWEGLSKQPSGAQDSPAPTQGAAVASKGSEAVVEAGAKDDSKREQEIELLQAQLAAMQQQIEALRDK